MKTLITVSVIALGLFTRPVIADEITMEGDSEYAKSIAASENRAVNSENVEFSASENEALDNVTTREITDQDKAKIAATSNIPAPSETLYDGSHRKYQSKFRIKKDIKKHTTRFAKNQKPIKSKYMAHWPKTKYALHKPVKRHTAIRLAHKERKSKLLGSQICSAD